MIVGHLSRIDSHALAAMTGLPLEAVDKTIQLSTGPGSAATYGVWPRAGGVVVSTQTDEKGAEFQLYDSGD